MSQVAQGQIKEVAERLGLAARSLPSVEVGVLVQSLADKLGLPLTTDKLASLTVADLAKMFAELRDAPQRDEIRMAVRYLWGEADGQDHLPEIQPYTEGDLPQSVKVAVASNTAENLDGHFGSARRFLVYQVATDAVRLIAIRDPLSCETAEDPNAARAEMLNDCQLLYVQSIGGPATAKVIRAGIHPVKFPNGGPIANAMAQLQTALQVPPPWLAQAMGLESSLASRFASTEDA